MGRVVISIDAELAWGVHDLYPLTGAQAERISSARSAWKRLVTLFDEFTIPATWAVVGQLLTEAGTDPPANYPGGEEWFETYRRERTRTPRHWSGIDLVDAVADADASHELACHTCSHQVFSEIPRAVADRELELSNRAGRRHGYEFESFVFPRNEVAHRSTLKDHGFICYRGARPTTLPKVTGLHGGAKLIGYLTGNPVPPIVSPEIDEHGLVNIPASLFIGGMWGVPWSSLEPIRGDAVLRFVKLGIDQLDDPDDVFHLWLHPNDLTDEAAFERMQAILSHLADRRDRGHISIETMRSVARLVREHEAPSVATEAVSHQTTIG